MSAEHYAKAKEYFEKGTFANNPNYSAIILGQRSTPKKLSTILLFASKKKYSKVVWLACRAVNLKDNGGRKQGFNTKQSNRTVTHNILNDHEIDAEYQQL